MFEKQLKSPRLVVISGGTRGIGLATAKAFLEHGDHVVIFCRHQEHVTSATTELSKYGKELHTFVGDVSRASDVQRIVKETEKIGPIDILINNAGVGLWKPLLETTETEWDTVLSINLKGQFLLSQAVLPSFHKRQHGIIIHLSSGLGLHADAKYGPYAASKFGVVALAQVETEETKGSEIKIYTVCPGGVATKLHLDMHPWENPKSMMTPEHIAEKILSLAEGKKASGSLTKIYY